MQILDHKSRLVSGFSLLEMLVVLSIIGVMLTLVSVRSMTILENVSFRNKSMTAIAEIQSYRMQAMLDQRNLVIFNTSTNKALWSDLNSEQIKYLNVPDDWSVTGDEIQITNLGMCLGGVIKIDGNNGRSKTFQLGVPKCDISASS